MADEEKSPGCARRLVTGAVGRFSDVSGSITGKGLEQELAEYGDTFTTVALGLKEDVDSIDRRLTQLEQAISEISQPVSSGIEASAIPKSLWLIALVGACAGVAALGVALWTAL